VLRVVLYTVDAEEPAEEDELSLAEVLEDKASLDTEVTDELGPDR
jgi:hypothetical protein